MIARIEPPRFNLPTQLIADAMTNRSEAVIKRLKKGDRELTLNFLNWVSVNLSKRSNSSFLSEIYSFVKYHSWDVEILDRIKHISRSILPGMVDNERSFNRSEFEKTFSESGLKFKVAKSYLKNLSQSDKVALFTPNEEGNTVFHYLPCDVERIVLFEKHCPPKLRKHLFSNNKEDRPPFCICRELPRVDEKLVDFLFSRADRDNLVSLAKPLKAAEVVSECSLKTLQLFLNSIPSNLHEEKLFSGDNLLMICIVNRREIYQRAKVLLENTPQPLRRKFFESEEPGEVLAVELVDACPKEIQPKMKELFSKHCPKELLEQQMASLNTKIELLELLEVVVKEKQTEELSGNEQVGKSSGSVDPKALEGQ